MRPASSYAPWALMNCISHHASRLKVAFLDHNSRHAACPGGAARSWFDGRRGGGGWRRWCSSSRFSTVARSSSSLSTSYPWLKRAAATAHSQGYRRGNERRVGPAGAGRWGAGEGGGAGPGRDRRSRTPPASSPPALGRRGARESEAVPGVAGGR